MVAAITDESLVEALHRLVTEELKRLHGKQG
jgi:hypothetical protein